MTAPTRIVASTAPVQIPAFVASAATPDTIVTALADALCGLGNDSSRACLRDDLCITGFARIDPADYAVAEDWARDAGQRGLEWIA